MKETISRYRTIGASTTFSGALERRELMLLRMKEPATLDDYASHSPLSDPGVHAGLISDLPLDIPAVCRILHGLLIHEAWIERQGFDPAAFSGQSRATLPVSKRLDQLLAIDPRPLTMARPGELRALATCRDFALMLCAILRQHGVPARVRCGFGTYFSGHPYHDHWVCEYWMRDEQRWVLVDAELDEPHRNLLKFDFEATDVPRTAFITGIEAWKRCRSGAMDPEQLGHGTTTGMFFARVNLARDLLALAKSETSAWDTWRAAREPHYALDDIALSLCDDLARRGEQGAVAIAPSLSVPPWQ
ncbi:transglutaminase domain-containing protein [Bradyrhizobium manausense]|uniref:transglutaminase-like domain-containing protein n=1 Tax=Bradyrhizobium manausense TaxID=989370 RepID=UPI001BAC9001|nr:transglutaminase-like domain-containing protein [Bradyrhizobium manausense]MBR0833808.1 transglutaminase domain-containing protein [Bradyrhizobium manausense]